MLLPKKTRKQVSKRNGDQFEVVYYPIRNKIEVKCIKIDGLAFMKEIDEIMKYFSLPEVDENIMSQTYKGNMEDFEKIVSRIEDM